MIPAIYTYFDNEGRLLFQAVRYQLKGFTSVLMVAGGLLG